MTRKVTRRTFLMGTAALLASACAGERPTAGGSAPPATPTTAAVAASPTEARESVSVALDWYPWSNHTGLLMARENGHVQSEGLDVTLEVPANPEDVLKLVATGRNTYGISYQTDVLLARAEGIPVVSIAALVQHPLNSVMALERSGITRPRDLAGKKVGYPGLPSDEALLATMLEADGARLEDVTLVNVGFELVRALLSGQVDAVIGAYWVHESILIEQQGEKPVILRVEQWGVPDFYELVMVTSEQELREHADRVQRFVRGMIRGYQDAARDLDAAVALLVREYPETNEELEKRGIRLLAPLWTEGVPVFGWQEERRWTEYASWMRQRGLLASDVDARAAFTNRFVESARQP
ncbi:ABC transporter substrate-binding protein [Thermomicrobium sp. 4228-Ro]|uniref:ABC transporter substrate-binding protein n=1 Tax=Thermomicrobium sp. 4228-Ro TaxID=2993937 RepID=UPI00224885E9|nr:ABC transporter substrate-binding protein [Thermomicrobium sp. 4228-Ro]MCX2726280.1 ABC transporter substrate-binding protein [Thermomicrobium sp. 4228-Ro]